MPRLVLLMFAWTLVSCDQPAKTSAIPLVAEASIATHFSIQQGNQSSQLMIAVTDLEKSRGLMAVEKLPPNTGMIFIYENDQAMRFWMKDTPLNLDIAFVQADGVIQEIKTMQAEDTTETASKSSQIRFCIEMPAGWYNASSVKVGDKINLLELERALTARGFQAARYLTHHSKTVPNRE